MSGQEQEPAGAAFLGARRAPSYFEEWPTESAHDARGAGGTDSDNVPQTGDIVGILETRPESEELLRELTQPTPAEPDEPAEAAAVAEAAPPVAQPVAQLVEPTPGRAAVAQRGGGWLQALLGKSSSSRAAAEQFAADQTAIRLSSWQRSVGVLVANPKGGTGKTPSAIALGGVFASIRGGQTVVYEVTDDPGGLSVRAEGPARIGIAELVRDSDHISGAGHLTSYIAQQTSYAAVVSSPNDRDPLDAAAVQRASDLLGFFYPVRIMDSGNQPSSSAFHGALSRADVLVVPVLDAADSLASAQQLLRYLGRLGGAAADLARRAIVLRIHDVRTTSREAGALVADSLAQAPVADVIEIPWDPHIAQRSTITFNMLRPATVQAYTRAAAAVVAQLNGQ